MPKVSVIAPAFNPGPYLDEAIKSLVAQTFTDWECIVVDDGSTEDLSRVENADPRVRLIRQPNRGVSAARNNAILNSTGEFIAFLDADDLYHPDKLSRQAAAMDHRPAIGYLHTGYRYIDASGADSGAGTANASGDYYDLLAGGEMLCPTAMVRRSLVSASGLFDPLLVCGEDADFALRVVRRSEVGFLSQELYYYRRHSANATGSYLRVYRQMDEVYRRHAAAALLAGDDRAYRAAANSRQRTRRQAGMCAYDAARKSLGSRNPIGFARNLGAAFRMAPGYTIGALSRFPLQRLANRQTAAAARQPG